MANILLVPDTLEEGYIILVTGLIIVFAGLLVLTIFFKYSLPVILDFYKFIKRGGKKEPTVGTVIVDKDAFTGEVVAAISMGIHMYLNKQHDNENAILTIKQARKLYSPWSSKIYATYGNRL